MRYNPALDRMKDYLNNYEYIKMEQKRAKEINSKASKIEEYMNRKSAYESHNQFVDDSIANVRPDLAEEWDTAKNGLEPSDVSIRSIRMAYWICSKCGCKWETCLRNRALGFRNCPRCEREALLNKH